MKRSQAVRPAMVAFAVTACVLLLACGGSSPATDQGTETPLSPPQLQPASPAAETPLSRPELEPTPPAADQGAEGPLSRPALESAISRGLAALTMMAHSGLFVSEIYVIDRILAVYPDDDLRQLVERQRRGLSGDPFYRFIDPSAPRPSLPADPGSGLQKLDTFTLAALGQPEERARSYIEEYLSMTGLNDYALTHQPLVIVLAREQGTIGALDYDDRLGELLDRLEQEIENSERFTDLYAEQVSVLGWGDPSRRIEERWVRPILAAQDEDGGWTGPGPLTYSFDGGERQVPTVGRAHTTVLALNALVMFYAQ